MNRKNLCAYVPVIFFTLLLSSAFSSKLPAEVNITARRKTQDARRTADLRLETWDLGRNMSESLQKERDLFKARFYYKEACRKFSNNDYYGAWENITKSLILAPDNAQAFELLIRLLALMDDPSVLQKIEAQRQIHQEFLTLTLKRSLNEARALIQERRFPQAAYLLERTIDTISYHPERASCAALVKEAEEEFTCAHLEKSRVQEMLHRRIAGLLAQAKDYLKSDEADKALLLTGLALILDPQDSQALSLHRMITGKPPASAPVVSREVALEKRPLPEKPRDWWRRKEPRAALPGLAGYWDWHKRIYEKLQQPISMEFTDTPLIDIIDFIRDVADVNIVVDEPACRDRLLEPISIKLTEVKIEAALRWVLRMADLGYTYRDEAIFISDSEFIKEAARRHLAIYDMRDLTAPVADYIGPRMGFGGSRGETDFGGEFGR